MHFETRVISVRYEKVTAVKDLSIRVSEGQIVALIGANGAGKTSTLRAISGLARLASGEIWFEGERIDMLSTVDIVARGIAMVPEGRRVFPHLSVKDNLLMGAYRRRDSLGIRNDLDKVLARFPHLAARLYQQGVTLSGGEQEMLAIGRALMARPKLLLLDEPSLGLAPLIVRQIGKMIIELNCEDKVGIILVEQNSRMALRVQRTRVRSGDRERWASGCLTRPFERQDSKRTLPRRQGCYACLSRQ